MIKPHGGKLINKITKGSKWKELLESTINSESIYLDSSEISDL